MIDCAEVPYELVIENQEFVQLSESSNCYQYTLISDANNAFSVSEVLAEDFIYVADLNNNGQDWNTGEGVYRVDNIINNEAFTKVQVVKSYDNTSDCSIETYEVHIAQANITLMHVLNGNDLCSLSRW